MYTRSYYPGEPEEIRVPENYDGTAFPEKKPEEADAAENERKTPEEVETSTTRKGDSPLSSIFSAFPLRLPFAQKSHGKGPLGIDIGLEEILIIGIALFLFFTKDSDRELALILLLSIFAR